MAKRGRLDAHRVVHTRHLVDHRTVGTRHVHNDGRVTLATIRQGDAGDT